MRTACREGFSKFITRAGLTKRPRIVACGSRRDAYESFCTAVAGGEDAMLLVDSESAVAADHQVGEPTTWRPWAHLKNRPGDGWDKPAGSSDTDCHLMVQCMEHWLLAHREQLEAYFGQGFQRNVLPAAAQGIETVTKAVAYNSIQSATKNSKTKGQYGKGQHSFELLALIDPAKVLAASPWAKRFVVELRSKMGG
ncbi:hypothetical protein FHX63_000261 [Cupriavidus plantarum]|nr:hypothetical protein [Cupriavidus plantarum]